MITEFTYLLNTVHICQRWDRSKLLLMRYLVYNQSTTNTCILHMYHYDYRGCNFLTTKNNNTVIRAHQKTPIFRLNDLWSPKNWELMQISAQTLLQISEIFFSCSILIHAIFIIRTLTYTYGNTSRTTDYTQQLMFNAMCTICQSLSTCQLGFFYNTKGLFNLVIPYYKNKNLCNKHLDDY